MPEPIAKPYLKMALKMIDRAGAALRSNSNNANAIARHQGFENAEHAALAFLASDIFELLIDGITGTFDIPSGSRSPIEYAQDMLDTVYGGSLKIVPSACFSEIVRRPGCRPSRKEEYVELKPREGACLLSDYEAIILEERKHAKVHNPGYEGSTAGPGGALRPSSGRQLRLALPNL